MKSADFFIISYFPLSLCGLWMCLTTMVIQVLPLQTVSPPFAVTTSPGGSYEVVVQGKPWLHSDVIFLRSDHKVWTTQDSSLVLCGPPRHSSGKDGLGRWDSVNYGYRLKSASPCVMDVGIKSYPERNLAIFSQTFQYGLHNTSSGDMNAVVTSFPSFSVDSGGSLGLLSFGGLFSFMGLKAQRFTKGLNITDGMGSGPLVFFDKAGSALVVSTFSEFMSTSMWYDQHRESLHWGVMGKAARIPATFVTETIVFYSPNGINQAMSGWGEVLRSWYKKDVTQQRQDLTISHLGYYTDNGAYYYHNLQPPFGNYEQFMIAKAGNRSIPYRYLQYDDWWYYIKGPGYGATVRWEAMPNIFPRGLDWLHNKTGLPVLAHNRYWSSTTPYAKQNGGEFEFIIYQDHSMPVEQKFWEWLFKRASRWGMVTYEQDWLNYQTERIFQLHSDVGLSSLWLNQMGAAAAQYNITIQYCMALPRHILQSLLLPAVTQARVSIDYHLQTDQWRIGVSSMFATAVGLAPFKDNFWTSNVEKGNPYNKTERSPLLQAMVSILSTGPVAPGDGYRMSNVSLISRLHRSDGLLLKPGRPALAIDAQIHEMAYQDGTGPSGEVWSTHSDISGLRFGIVFAADLNTSYSIGPTLAGFGKLTHPTVAYSYRNEGFSGGVLKFSDEHPLELEHCPITEPCLWYTTPYLTYSGQRVALLGELDKFVPMSPQRVLQVTVSANDVQVVLQGVPGEVVTFSVFTSSGQVRINCSKFGPHGHAVISVRRLQCFVLKKHSVKAIGNSRGLIHNDVLKKRGK